ncbi:MAG TPA: SDR family oxidoreductase, partial [Planctomycetota bacterium]|nr:SDR family oxidoreductase [Planctomycetota bacterium]
ALGALGGSARAISADATDPRTAEIAIDRCVEEFGSFDGLYHVAGGSGRKLGDGPLHELTDEGIDGTLRLNLASVAYSNRAAAKRLLAQRTGGAVLNMASVLGFAPSPHFFATHVYAAAKAGIIGMTRAAAAYYAPHGIRFNAVAPGLIDTPMAARAVNDAGIRAFTATKQPLDGGRMGRPDDLDAAVVFFLSDAAKFVTGQVLAVDGGWSVTEGQHLSPAEGATYGDARIEP